MFDLTIIHKPCFQCYYLSFCGLSSLPFNSTDRDGSNAPTAWRRPCRLTWSWSASPPWRTRACSSVGASSGTRSPARRPSMGPYGPFVPRACSATAMITEPQLSRPVLERPPAKSPGSSSPPPLGRAQLRQANREGCLPPCGEMGAGSCSCFTQRPRGWRAGVRKWRRKLRRTTCRRTVSLLLKPWCLPSIQHSVKYVCNAAWLPMCFSSR